jgi:hypothetical protein
MTNDVGATGVFARPQRRLMFMHRDSADGRDARRSIYQLLVQGHFPIHRPRPGVNPAAHRLRLLEPLLPQPIRHIQ